MASRDSRIEAPAGDSRVVAIDILRGFAILWVVLFHLWSDVKLGGLPPADYLHTVADRVHDGQWGSLGTALVDAFFRIGFQGVPLFMMLSGLALYLSASRRGPIDLRAFYRTRLRRTLVPYWAGFVLLLLGAVGVAAIRSVIDDGAFADHYHHGVTVAIFNVVDLGWSDALIHGLLVTRLWSNEWFGADPSSLWFAVVIVQYYLVFPFLRRALDRVGPWRFLGAALAINVIARIALIRIEGGLLLGEAVRLDAGVALFRYYDFALGMTLGWLFVHRRRVVEEYVSSPLDIAGLMFVGLLLHLGGTLVDDRQAYVNAFSAVLTATGLTLLALPLLAKAPGRLERTPPMAVLAWTGPLSFAVLIVNDPIRLFASLLRIEGVSDPVWWLFLTLVYVPLTLLLARPVAVLVGLVDRAPPAVRDQAPAPVSLAEEPAQVSA